MYKIEQHSFGFRLTFADFIKPEEMAAWVNDSKPFLAKAPKTFGVLVDMRTLKGLPEKSVAYLQEGQKLYKEAGMQRSAVVRETMMMVMQIKNIAIDTGIYAGERYISAEAHPDWEKVAMDWIVKGIDPDQQAGSNPTKTRKAGF